MIDFTEIDNGETWELFARDFLLQSGYHIESVPDRGADGGKDLLAVENLSGSFGRHPFRWLVSCKHFAHSNRAVRLADEADILERLQMFDADGFVGVYSTLPSAGLNDRLNRLRERGRIRDSIILDRRRIESILLQKGYVDLLIRYFPQSYRRLKPLHRVEEEYLPLHCANCGRDLLEDLHDSPYMGITCHAYRIPEDLDYDGPDEVVDVYWVHKGHCDERITSAYEGSGCWTSWEDLDDLIIPWWYLRRIAATMSILRDQTKLYSEEAYQNEVYLLRAISQKVFRYTTESEWEKLESLWGSAHMMV
jgi:hypothetical protein